jgi:hypothetical protein
MMAFDAASLPSRPARAPWWRVRPVLAVAFAASIALHVLLSFVPEDVDAEPESAPLTATITELPPPPVAAPAPAPSAPKPAPPPRRKVAPDMPPAPVAQAPVEPQPAQPPPASPPAAAPAASEPPAAETPPVLAEDVAQGPPPVAKKTLPPRVDLAYRVFYGSQGFLIGSATYRFEHAENRYRIATVGEARGLAALLFRGRGRMESRGVITGSGLQPHEFVVDKFNRRGVERAEFDWETGIATLHGDQTVSLELPTFDILTLIWQFYFQPPETGSQTFALATTRRLNRVTVSRQREETIEWGSGPIPTEVWHRTSNDGRTDAYVWLAPSLRWLPVKMRVVNTTRGTVEAVLDRIRVDETHVPSLAADAPLDPEPMPAAPAEGAPATTPSDPFSTYDHRS